MTSSDHKKNLRGYLHRLCDSLQGKPTLDLPDVCIRSPEIMIRDLLSISEADWWKYAFSREPMNGRFSDKERQSLYLQALACGKEQADACMEKYGICRPEELAARMNLDVFYPQMPQSRSRILFADFAEPETIRVYRDGLIRSQKLLQNPKMIPWLPEGVEISDILIAHELYHVLEMRNPSVWSKSYRMTLWQIGKLKNSSPIAVLSEISAMAFAARLNHLTFSPYVLDAFLVYGYSPGAASALAEEMMQYAREAQKFSGAACFVQIACPG